jgi:hypothetical protein
MLQSVPPYVDTRISKVSSRFKPYDAAGWDIRRLAGFGIAPDAGTFVPHLKGAKAAKDDRVTGRKAVLISCKIASTTSSFDSPDSPSIYTPQPDYISTPVGGQTHTVAACVLGVCSGCM